ncbi:glycoside hydrolase family 3 protein [Robertkochia flava]|uniref:glycoside hydrolase family 3 protein n=1 Tax=Robertkochia flava TaxID=3447986 RepID=UPI001CCB4BE7|nr:glycoside hydrolase family 3 protein [Robertkochia marina]
MKTSITKILSNSSLDDLAGQLFCPAAFINDDAEGIRQIETLIREHKIGGLTFFHSRASAATNYEKKEVIAYRDSLEKLKSLIAHYQSLSEIPLLISIDAEWGLAMRVENTPCYPYAITLGAMPEEGDDLIYQAALQMGKDLKSVGIDYNLAPVVDINSNPDNPVIGYRSFGESRENVTRKAAAFCRGLADAGILNSLKHFPGHGDTAVDSHLGLPVIKRSRAEMLKEDLAPFRALIDRGVDSVMVGHLAVPALSGHETLPATLSEKIIKGLLREEFGFDGVVISDALNMHSVCKIYSEKGILEQKAFEAGNDILCFSEHIAEGKNKILDHCGESAIKDSVARILAMKEKVGLLQKKERQGAPDLVRASKINREIAALSMIRLSEQPSATDIPDTFVCIGAHEKENGFLEELRKTKRITTIRVEENTGSLKLSTRDPIAIALYPPNIKPHSNFGISPDNLELIEQLLNRHRVTLLLFGNPYAIRVITSLHKAYDVIVSGQDLPEFQTTAARVLKGDLQAKGQMPFHL